MIKRLEMKVLQILQILLKFELLLRRDAGASDHNIRARRLYFVVGIG